MPSAKRRASSRRAGCAAADDRLARARPNDPRLRPSRRSTPEFDLASLPSLDSITAATDIRAFLTPGVPTELARAALRRAWAADPGDPRLQGARRERLGLHRSDRDAGVRRAAAGHRHQEDGGADLRRREKPTEPDVANEPAASEAPDIAGKSEPPPRQRSKWPRPPKSMQNPARRRFRPASNSSRKAILCSAIIILHRTIVIPMMRQKSARTAAITAVHCLNRKSYP